MGKLLKEYRVFASRKMRIIENLCLLGAFGLSILICGVLMGPALGMIFVSMTIVLVISFIDFYMFGGIAVKGQTMMDFVRSSYKGMDVVRKAIIEDAYINMARALIISLGSIIISDFILTKNFHPNNLVYALIIGFTVTSSVYFNQIITRKFAKTMMAHMGCIYILTIVASLLLVPPVVIIVLENGGIDIDYIGSVGIAGYIYLVIAILLAFVLNRILVKTCINGFKSGYRDTL